MELFVKYFKIQYPKVIELNEFKFALEIINYCRHLNFLKNSVKKVYLRNRWFGLEVFLSELDDLFSNYIDPLKKSLDTFLSDPSLDNLSAVNRAFSHLALNLYKCSFIEIKGNEIRSVIEYFDTAVPPFDSDDSFRFLYNYLDTGEVLKIDTFILQFIEQISKLHREADPIYAYSDIIGPSFMSKTQVAFAV